MSRMRHHEPAMEDDTMEQPDDARGAAWLVERFAEFNRLYFGGRLPYRIIISMTRTSMTSLITARPRWSAASRIQRRASSPWPWNE